MVTDLGILHIYDLQSMAVARRKTREIASSLGCGTMFSTRLETFMSQLFRNLMEHSPVFKVVCSLELLSSHKLISFEIQDLQKDFGNKSPHNLAYRLESYVSDNGLWILKLLIQMPPGIGELSTATLESVKTMLEVKSREHLLREITSQNKALELAKLAAEEASQTKANFLANMSHEIRTPMNAIIGTTHLIQKTPLSPKQMKYAERISQSSQHLLGIINDILDFSKIEAGKLSIESTPFSLRSVFAQVYNLFEERCEAKGIKLTTEVDSALPDQLRGDPLRLGQILINFTSNAIKFTDQGQVSLAARLVGTHEDHLEIRFSVQDTGIGLMEQQVGKLFNSFQQGDASTTRKYGGTGLGLAISKNLAHLMGGEVGVDTTFGAGSTFWFTAKLQLGFAGSEAPADAPLNQNVYHSDLLSRSGSRILVVDDNEVNLTVATDLLTGEGFRVETASNGKEAVEKTLRQNYDLILMDMQMPVMDGLRATQEIRAHTGVKQLPIIALTANAMLEEIEKCRAAGMDDYLAKPIEPKKLFETLLKWIPETRAVPVWMEKGNLHSEDNPDDPKSGFEILTGIDPTVGLRRMMGKKAFYDKLLAKFIASQRDALSSLEVAIEQTESKNAEMIAHTLKGLAGTIGALELEVAVTDIEAALRAGVSQREILELVDVAKNKMDPLISGIEAYLDKLSTVKSEITVTFKTDKELLDALEQLKPEVEMRKAKTCSTLLEQYRNFVWPQNLALLFAELDRKLSKYKYKEAKDILESMMEALRGRQHEKTF